MSNPSNLYAEKIFAENPTALWALDEKCDFVSYLADDIYPWTYSGDFDSKSYSTNLYPIIEDSPIIKIVGDPGVAPTPGSSKQIVLTSNQTFSSSTDSFTVSFYIYSENSHLESVEIVYGTADGHIEIVEAYQDWYFVSHTFFDTPTSDSLILNINYSVASELDLTPNYDFYIHGFSIGYRSEEFNAESVGTSLFKIDQNIKITDTYGIPAYAYGSNENYGYYIGSGVDNILYAKNSSLPMVFGASNSTILYPNSNGPSLIVPGFGFLNDSGKYKNTVLEAWIKVVGSPASNTRIIGPVESTDGLYVDGPFLIFRVGNNIISHPVGEWHRPMLIHLEFDNGKMAMYINGELIKSIRINLDELTLPERYDENGKDQDYIGFYADGVKVKTLNVDCVAIYPYAMSNVVTRRRFGYGQAAKLPENMHVAYGGLHIYPEFSQTGQSKTGKLYGTTNDSWNKPSYKENIFIGSKSLQTPRYDLPNVVLSRSLLADNEDNTKWFSDLYAAQSGEPFMRVRPNSEWDSISGYLLLDSISILGKNKQLAISGVFEKDGTADDTDIEQMLIRFEDRNTGDHLYASLLNEVVFYKYKVGNTVGTISSQDIGPGQVKFAIAFDFSRLSTINQQLRQLIKNKNNFQMYVGGDYSGDDLEVSTTFSGKIFSFEIHTKESFGTISTLFASNGLLTDVTDYSDIQSSPAPYRVKVLEKDFDGSKVYSMDIETKSLWIDYVPLASFSQKVKNNAGVVSDGLDFIQFNMNYPQYAISDSYAKAYVMFKYQTDAIVTDHSSLTTVSLASTKIVTPGSTWANKKYEVVDESLIYLPTSFASGKTFRDLDIVVFFEMKSEGAIAYPMQVRKLQLSPMALNNTSSTNFNKTAANKIGTKYSTASLYPYTKSGNTYDYNNLNPFFIHTETFPYLNLTKKSGIKVANSYSSTSDRGFLIPINEAGIENFNLSSIDMSILFNDSTVPSSEIALFEIISSSAELRIFMSRPDSSVTNRGILTAKQKNSLGEWEEYLDIEYYLNGKKVRKPVIYVDEWAMLGLLFTKTLDMSGSTNSKVNIIGSVLVANLSYYQIDSAKLAQQNVQQIWSDIKIDSVDDSINLWNEYSGLTWFDVAFSQSSVVPQISPKLTYSIYTGTNKIFANLASDTAGLRTREYQYRIYKNSTWQSFKRSAV